MLKTGIVHPPISPPSSDATPTAITTDLAVTARVGATSLPVGEKPTAQVNAQQLATAQKLLLFWRKPARKCWWDATDLLVNDVVVKVWARRVWTLETSLI